MYAENRTIRIDALLQARIIAEALGKGWARLPVR